MKQTVYLETSIVSYLTARPSRDLIVAAHQQITHEWWDHRRSAFELYTSQIVISEASGGDQEAARKRIEALKGIPLLDVQDEAAYLAEKLLAESCLPQKAVDDALHIAVATIHKMDYLLTWNCKHIANSQMRPKIEQVILEQGYLPPIISTPEELLGG